MEETPEIIIIDDGSTDNTRVILESLINSGQVKYHYQTNQGKASVMAKGIELASGELIFNLDADDYFLPGKIKETIAVFRNHPSVVHVANAAQVVFEDHRAPYTEQIPKDLLGKELDGKKLLHRFYSNKMLYGGGSTFAGRAKFVKKINWHAAIDMYADEWLLMQTLLQGSSYFIPEAASVWWVHGYNYSYSIGKGITKDKYLRLVNSSITILSLLEDGDYPRWLRKRYRFKHEHRVIMWLEAMKKKDLTAIWQFVRKGILSGNSWRVLRKYHAFRRLFPSRLIALFKSE